MKSYLPALAGVLAVVVVLVTGSAIGSQPLRSASKASVAQPGDVDCDSDIDTADVLWILKYLAELEPFAECIEEAGDTTCDGRIDAEDGLRILNVIATLLGQAALNCPMEGGYELATLHPGGFVRAVHFAVIPGSETKGILATQKEARLYIIDFTDPESVDVFGDLSDRAGGGTELEGLLNFAFSPSFANDHLIYVYYTRGYPEPAVLSSFEVIDNRMDAQSETVILEVPSLSGYNYGGNVEFDSEGSLYLSIGDGGGSAGDAQDTNSILGSVVRLRTAGPTAHPHPNNPFIDEDGADEIFAYGFRNPWRMSIDTLTDDVYLGDVGELAWEEINAVRAGGNYGWDVVEGNQCVVPGCDLSKFDQPLYTYPHFGEFTSITGGHVYRGQALPELYGWYLYAEFYQGQILAINPQSTLGPVLLVDTEFLFPSFSRLPNGEIAIIGFDGAVYQLARTGAEQ